MTASAMNASTRKVSGKGLATGLGLFSLGLGLVELLAPNSLARSLGMEGQERLLQAYGIRELGTGLGILAAADPSPWIQGRIGGDLLDLGTLAVQMRPANPGKGLVALALGMVAGVAVLDVYCLGRLREEERQVRALRWDYRDRSGWPRPPEAMRGIARDAIPRDMQAPKDLRPYH